MRADASATPLIPYGQLPPPRSGTPLADGLKAPGLTGVTDAEAQIFDPSRRENPATRTYLYVYTRARYPFWLSTYLPRGLPSDPPTDTFLQADAGWKDGRLELNKVTPICLTRKECP